MTEQSSRIWWLVGTVLGAAAFWPYLYHIHRLELVYPIGAAVISIMGVVWVSSELRGQLWFWATIVVVAALHVPIILYIPWRAGWIPAPLIFIFCVADAMIILGIIQAIQKLKDGTSG
jgi:hypothetical protein